MNHGKPKPFTSDDFERCSWNIYSKDCIASMLETFADGSRGSAVMEEWLDGFASNKNLYWIGFTFPFILLNYFLFILPGSILFGEGILPPLNNEAYDNVDFFAWAWYWMLSFDTQFTIPFAL